MKKKKEKGKREDFSNRGNRGNRGFLRLLAYRTRGTRENFIFSSVTSVPLLLISLTNDTIDIFDTIF